MDRPDRDDVSPPAPSRIRWTRWAALALLGFATAFVTTEIVLRLAAPRSVLLGRLLHRPGEAPAYERFESLPELLESTPFHPTPFVAWGGFKLSSRGLRTHEYEREKRPGVYRAVVLGDSFAFDSGFVPWDRIWHHRVGVRLERRLGRPVEVINLGVPAVGPRFYRRMFELEGSGLAPDLVLLSFFVGNDLTDETGARGSLLLRWSRAWRLATALARHPQALSAPAKPPHGPGGRPVRGRPYDPEEPLNDAETYARLSGETALLFRRDAWQETERRIAEVVTVLADTGALVREAGARFIVVVIPDRIAVEEGGPSREEHDFDRVHGVLRESLHAAGIETVDLLAPFRQAAETERLYRRLDTHWSAAGNELAAAQIEAALIELGIAPARP